MTDNLLTQLTNLRHLFAEATPTDSKVINDYAWTIVKALLQHTTELDSFTSRQLLADCLKLPIECPSKLYSALLSAAVKVSTTYPDFRFAAFLNLWGIDNLRPEDYERQQATVPAGCPAGKSFPSLAEKTARALAHSLLLHPEDRPSPLITPSAPLCSQRRVAELSLPVPAAFPSSITSLLSTYGLSIHPLLVTRIKQATGKDGRKYTFVTLTSPEGLEIETVSHTLQPSPLHPLPEGKRHYVNIGQLYDCLLRQKQATVPDGSPSGNKAAVPASSQSPVPDGPQATVPDGSPSGQSSLSLKEAYLSPQRPTEVFPTEIGYLESIDQQHSHIHIYDSHSRHFAAPILRFSKERVGDFVRFIPIIPAASKFKTAIIQGTVPASALHASVPSPSPSALLATVPSDSSEGHSLLREIRITSINHDKAYAAWELTDKTHPITELLSPLQLSQGETSPTFTTGYINLTTVPAGSHSDQTATVPAGFPSDQTATIPAGSPSDQTAIVPAGSPSDQTATVPAGSPAGSSVPFREGWEGSAFIYLKRGKDRQKRPHIAQLFNKQ